MQSYFLWYYYHYVGSMGISSGSRGGNYSNSKIEIKNQLFLFLVNRYY